MGIYLNPNNVNFYNAVHDDIYVDKTSMIDFTNGCLNKSSRFMCVSRPRKIGKSIAAAMLTAYYSKGCDSRELFKGLDIESMPSFKSELNKNNVIYIDISQFRSKANVTGELASLDLIQKAVIEELAAEFPNTVSDDDRDIPSVLEKTNYKNGAIAQIKDKRYSGALDEYSGDVLLVGISYDKDQKKHECVIEHLNK